MTRRIGANQEGRFQPVNGHSKRQEQDLKLEQYPSLCETVSTVFDVYIEDEKFFRKSVRQSKTVS